MNMRASLIPVTALPLLALAACGEEPAPATEEIVAQDPLLARALNDPLLVDPDLSWRSEANAAIAWRDGHPLPLFTASPGAAERARDAARNELLDGGRIPPLPGVRIGEGSASLAGLTTAGEIVAAVGGREDCSARLGGGLGWSTRMPDIASVMPHGMVQQAAGVDAGNCVMRVVRYLTPASADDVLEYHFTKVDRERFRIDLFDTPERQLRAERRDQVIAVHVREGPGDMTAVDVVHWFK